MNTNAIVIEHLGAPEVLVAREIPLPDPGAHEVHVRVRAAGVNFADLVMRAGLYGTVPDRPFSPGFEIAGEVARVGAGVTTCAVGDPVVAVIRHGGYARDVIVPAANVFAYPPSLGPEHAAAVPVAFLTAWTALFEAARVRAGEVTLVLMAAGGVGSAAVQLARWRGLRVIGTAGSERKRRFVIEELGAEACFDTYGGWERRVEALVGPRGIDVALDALGGSATAACRRLLGPLGRLVFYGLSAGMPGQKRNWPKAILAYLKTPRFHPSDLIQPNLGIFGIHLLHLERQEAVLRGAMAEIFDGVGAGELKPVLDRTFPLTRDGAVEAHHYLHGRKNIGKVVLVTDR